MNFEEVYKEYLIYAQKRHKKQGFYTITHDFKNHVLPYFRNYDISSITKFDIINWQNSILEKNFRNKFNAKLYYVFSTFMDYCLNCSYIDVNVVKQVGQFKKKIEFHEYTTYNLYQFRKFRKYLNDFVLKQYFTMIYFYGPRPGETSAFRFVDLHGRYLKVNHTLLQKVDRELDTPKNRSSIRYLKLNFIMLFRIWLLKRHYIKFYGVFSIDYFIFGGQKPLSHTTVDRYKKDAYTRANLPSITQHEFRHSYATRKIHKRIPIDIVSRSMGHSQVSTTLNIYLHQEKNVRSTLLH